jgi:predicted enzyme related to lactoylglutathione lyase
MIFTSIRIITEDVKRLVGFFETVTNLPAKWFTEDFAEITTSSATLALASTRTLSLFGEAVPKLGHNGSIITEFLVPNVDAEYERLKDILSDVIQKPTTMPWGNRSLLFKDPR